MACADSYADWGRRYQELQVLQKLRMVVSVEVRGAIGGLGVSAAVTSPLCCVLTPAGPACGWQPKLLCRADMLGVLRR